MQSKLIILVESEGVIRVCPEDFRKPWQILFGYIQVKVVERPTGPMQVPGKASRKLVAGFGTIEVVDQSADRTFLTLRQSDAKQPKMHRFFDSQE